MKVGDRIKAGPCSGVVTAVITQGKDNPADAATVVLFRDDDGIMRSAPLEDVKEGGGNEVQGENEE